MGQDYRNTSYTNFDFSLGKKKFFFMKELRKHHKRAKNIYNIVKDRSSPFNAKFREIYHGKCVYCGISTQVIASSDFEVDHVIPKTNTSYSYAIIHGIKNVVSACRQCNRGKLDLSVNKSKLNLIHPDKNKLKDLFFRDKNYAIKITNTYLNDSVVQDLYESLKLSSDLKRIDFLLMELHDFCNTYPNLKMTYEIKNIIYSVDLFRKKNY